MNPVICPVELLIVFPTPPNTSIFIYPLGSAWHNSSPLVACTYKLSGSLIVYVLVDSHPVSEVNCMI